MNYHLFRKRTQSCIDAVKKVRLAVSGGAENDTARECLAEAEKLLADGITAVYNVQYSVPKEVAAPPQKEEENATEPEESEAAESTDEDTFSPG